MTTTDETPSRSGAAEAPDGFSAPCTEPMIELRDVFCVHRTSEGDAAALQGATLEVARGELVCVLGPSGAGKSTLLRVIAGLQVPSAGVVRVLDRDIGRLPGRARATLRHQAIGFLGQHADSLVSPDLRVREVVALPLALRAVGREAQRARVAELLDAAALGDRADALADELSGGERQRVALCAALAHRPSLLLADEPTGELDARSAASVRALIAELARTHGTTAIIVSHDPAAAESADRSVRLRDGRVVEDRRAGDSALVVGRGGWLHLPPELRSAAGIRDRVHVSVRADGLLVSAAHPAARTTTTAVPVPARGADWSAARLELRTLGRSRGRGARRREVIAGLSTVVTPGRLTAVTGRSGAGKTTLLRLIAGLDQPDSGELLIDAESLRGYDHEQLAELRRRRIGYLPQEPSPVGFLSAEENVVLALRLRGWSARRAGERAAVVLGWVGLSERRRQRVARLSAGEAQRVALARALASARGLLVVDEPTSRLDRANAGVVAGLLAAAATGDRQTVICATHDPDVIARVDDVIELG